MGAIRCWHCMKVLRDKGKEVYISKNHSATFCEQPACAEAAKKNEVMFGEYKEGLPCVTCGEDRGMVSPRGNCVMCEYTLAIEAEREVAIWKDI